MKISCKMALKKHFTGLRPSQFEVLHDFLDDVCPLETINSWKSKDCPATENARTGPKAHFSSREKLFTCLLRLKRGFTLNTIAALLSTPNRKINFSYIGKIFTTFIQLMYVIFRDMQNFMFQCKKRWTSLHDSYSSWHLYICRCLLYTSPSPRDLSTSRMPSSA